MANYPLNRTVFNKDAYEKTIDTSFSQVSTPPLPLTDTISVGEFLIFIILSFMISLLLVISIHMLI